MMSLLAGCKPGTDCGKPEGAQGERASGGDLAAADFSTRFSLKIGKKDFVAQLALTQLEVANGLMWRGKLADDEGMLFIFREEARREFWMRNVPIPLALGYFSTEGRLDEIKAMVAQNPEPIPSRSSRVRFVLEMPEGWFEANDIRPGAELSLDSIRKAVMARGFKPENYGL